MKNGAFMVVFRHIFPRPFLLEEAMTRIIQSLISSQFMLVLVAAFIWSCHVTASSPPPPPHNETFRRVTRPSNEGNELRVHAAYTGLEFQNVPLDVSYADVFSVQEKIHDGTELKKCLYRRGP